jgi:hypothetical protein
MPRVGFKHKVSVFELVRTFRSSYWAVTVINFFNSSYKILCTAVRGVCSLLGLLSHIKVKLKVSSWPQSASELYRPSDRRLSAKLVSTSAARGCRVISATIIYGSILGFLNRSRYFFFQVASQLLSQGWVDSAHIKILKLSSLCTC